MNKKAVIACVSAIAVLVAVIVLSVVFLYSGGKGNSEDEAAVKVDRNEYRLLSAVPSDAAMLMSFKNLSSAVSLVNDPARIFSVVLTDAMRNPHPFRDFVDSLGKSSLGRIGGEPAALSLHYIGNIEPLLVMSTGKAQTDTSAEISSMLSLAKEMKLHSRFVDCSAITAEDNPLHKTSLILVSSSETLLTASVRHLENGTSIFDKVSFAQAAAAATGSDVLFVSHDYMGKLMQSYMLRPYSSASNFLGKVGDWTVLSVKGNDDKLLSLKGLAVASPRGQGAFVNVLSGVEGGEQRFTSAIPAGTLFAVSLSSSDISSYIESYRRFLDADGKLEKFNLLSRTLKDSVGIDPLNWARTLDIKEVTKAVVPAGDSLFPLIYVRPGKENADLLLRGTESRNIKDAAQVHANVYSGFIPALLGDFFNVDDSYAVYKEGWLVLGSRRALENAGEDKLKTNLSAIGMDIPGKDVCLNAYFSVSLMPSVLDEIFRPAMAAQIKETLAGVTDEALSLGISGEGMQLSVVRAVVAPDKKAPTAAVRDTVVYIPQGPFEVTNSGTGKTNMLSQSANGTLSLRDENGKGLWGIPFKGRLCGRVETIDYYNNGKLQFLFASGSKLYLLDRLGRFVNPFPVDLGKEILLGPAAYDFTGAKGYTAMVLHTDGSVGMYDLHGRVKDGWKGIVTDDTIKSLPELVEVKGKKYWAVRTSLQLQFYDFLGGEPLTKLSGNKMIRPDSEVTVQDGQVSVTCFDGKVRNVKL